MRTRTVLLCVAALVLSTVAPHAASNIDPGRRFAYAENIGWLNLEPNDASASGVVVSDFELTGWAWSENAGWISLSCSNRSTCGSMPFGVTNDGKGHLAGLAWSENLGWINFNPATAGVFIDPTSGTFGGRAWSENAGWISFASAGPVPFSVATSWRCPTGTPVPGFVTGLAVQRSGAATSISWSAASGATAYDVVRGDVSLLRSTHGDFSQAAQLCVARKWTLMSVNVSSSPPVGGAHWYLTRAADCGGPGTFDEQPAGQIGSRDAEIAISAANCP